MLIEQAGGPQERTVIWKGLKSHACNACGISVSSSSSHTCIADIDIVERLPLQKEEARGQRAISGRVGGMEKEPSRLHRPSSQRGSEYSPFDRLLEKLSGFLVLVLVPILVFLVPSQIYLILVVKSYHPCHLIYHCRLPCRNRLLFRARSSLFVLHTRTSGCLQGEPTCGIDR